MSVPIRRALSGLLAVLLLGVFVAPQTAEAATARRCFRETGYCISGRMREYWEQNGGLMVFGLPITPQQLEPIEGTMREVQWFERSRLELHPEKPWPYDVLLGRLGADRLTQQRRDWKRFSRQPAGPDCQVFQETGHSVCGEILAAWRAAGLNLDGDGVITEYESLALFGLPISDLRTERMADGAERQIQWFERGRFELHPENAWPHNVLLGLLGSEISPLAAAAPSLEASMPTRVVIGGIGVNQGVVEVGVDGSGELVVPDHDIGWWDQSAPPGAGENIVLWGHVLRFAYAPGVPAPFERLRDLGIGARITLYDDLGVAHEYAVTEKVLVTPDQVSYILPQGRERVTLVSCDGEFIIQNGSVVNMTQRLITIAEPV